MKVAIMNTGKQNMNTLTDELIARRLQAEYDNEYENSQRTEDEDRKLALKLAASHNISDSDSSEPEITKATTRNPKYVYAKAVPKENVDRKGQSSTSNSKSESCELSSKPVIPECNSNNEHKDGRPICQYGAACYRKNPEHFKEFKHPRKSSPESSKEDVSAKKVKTSKDENKIGFFFTTVSGIQSAFNHHSQALGIKNILSAQMGQLTASVQFNYMFDIPWLMDQYPQEFRHKPLLLVHGEKQESKRALIAQASAYKNITFCQALLEYMFGTHHTKMMFLLYENGLRIVIHTSNLVSQDWHQKTQGIWLSPVFPKLEGTASVLKGDSDTFFKRDLLEYLVSYKAKELSEWCEQIKSHDMSSASVYLVGSVPGGHSGEQKTKFGHLRLRRILQDVGPTNSTVDKSWPVIAQFSSIGSLGPNPQNWLCGEFLSSLATTNKSVVVNPKPYSLRLVYPSVNNVRMSLEGYPAGASLPYNFSVAQKQPWLNDFFHQWKCKTHGRSLASPHIKSYMRVSPDNKRLAWMLITSANLSKAAWGAVQKKESQLTIRSYELGVLFLPHLYRKTVFEVAASEDLIIPFDLPLTPYDQQDQPWIWNIRHMDLDRHCNSWEPP